MCGIIDVESHPYTLDPSLAHTNHAPENADECPQMQKKYDAQVKKELVYYRGLDPPAPD